MTSSFFFNSLMPPAGICINKQQSVFPSYRACVSNSRPEGPNPTHHNFVCGTKAPKQNSCVLKYNFIHQIKAVLSVFWQNKGTNIIVPVSWRLAGTAGLLERLPHVAVLLFRLDGDTNTRLYAVLIKLTYTKQHVVLTLACWFWLGPLDGVLLP